MESTTERLSEIPVLLFVDQAAWTAWLEQNHVACPGIWLRLAKKASGIESVNYAEALDVALCYGWIDGQKKGYDETSWLQKFTPRGAKSIWSKINREKVQGLIERGQMQPAGLKTVIQAQQDGRWDAAYDSARSATVPEDFQAALDSNPVANAFFATLTGSNRYAILFRLQTAKKAETRAKWLQKFIQMLENHETIHG
ncbi:YdeI/OmpD-associated family protein [soil metagenome]